MRNICILGAGNVGLVSAACFAELGNQVTCVDVDEERIAGLRSGRMPFYEPGLGELVQRNISAGRLRFSTEYAEAVPGAHFIFLCLPTPPSPNGAADTSILRSAVRTLAPLLSPPYPVIVNKSTAPIGTGAGLESLLARTSPDLDGLCVVSNPEFLREGSAISDFMHPDRVVIGAPAPEAAALRELYAPLGAPVLATDASTAEMTKYASNAFLAAKISFVNELADICEHVGTDVAVVTEGMGLDKRIGKSFLRPGVGYGGSCFPKDVLALAHTAAIHGSHPRILRAVMEVNSDQFKKILHKLRFQLGDLRDTVIAVWGIAYKPDTDDIREAPAIEIMRLLEQEEAHVRAYDPTAMPKAAREAPFATMCATAYEAAEGADAVLLLTEWSEFTSVDLEAIARSMRTPVFIDGRNVLDPQKARAAGLCYIGVGRGKVRRYRRDAVALPR